MDILSIIVVMGELFAIMVLGFYLRKKGILGGTVDKGLSWLVVNLTAPLLVYSSVYGMDNSEKNVVLIMLGVGMLSYIVYILFGEVFVRIFRTPKGFSGTMRFMLVFANSGYMGYPVLQALYGPRGIFYASIFNLIYSLFVYTYGIKMIQTDSKVRGLKAQITWRNFVSMGIIMCVISIGTYLLELPQPYPAVKVCDMLGNMTTPLSMLIIGSSAVDCDWKATFKNLQIYLLLAGRLLVLPIVMYLLVSLLPVNDFIRAIVTVLSAMPAGSMTVMMAQNYEGNKQFASEGVVVTTLLCVATVPIVAAILHL